FLRWFRFAKPRRVARIGARRKKFSHVISNESAMVCNRTRCNHEQNRMTGLQWFAMICNRTPCNRERKRRGSNGNGPSSNKKPGGLPGAGRNSRCLISPIRQLQGGRNAESAKSCQE